MKSSLDRIWKLDRVTIGKFYFNEIQICYILEDKERAAGVKIANETCIPSGLKYFISRAYSPRFKRIVPVIYTDVIGKGDSPDDFVIKDSFGNVWRCVEIHPGNSEIDTDACQLPGTGADIHAQRVSGSVAACDKLYPLIFGVLDRGEIIEYSIQDV